MGFYAALGYTRIEVPWMVPYRSSAATLDDERRSFKCTSTGSMNPYSAGDSAYLIGSAEQGVIERIYSNRLQPGRYVSCSPCFRNEPVKYDALHPPQFMKVELNILSSIFGDRDFEIGTPEETIEEIMHHARSFMQSISPCSVEIDYLEEVTDLTINGIEVGSYGMRLISGTQMLFYGTGLALPRFEQAINNGSGDSL